MRPFFFWLVFGLSSLAWGHGAVVTSPYGVASARTKIRARPDLFSVAGQITVTDQNETTLASTFQAQIEACGRNAEIHLRIDKKIGPKDRPDDATAKRLFASLMEKLDGHCASTLDFFMNPWPQTGPGVLASWAKVFKKATGPEYKVAFTVPALSDAHPGLLKFAEAEAVLAHADGLSIYLQEYRPDSAGPFLEVLTQNLVWASAYGEKHGKKIVIYLPGYVDMGWGPLPGHRNLPEALKAVFALKKEQAQGFCSDAVRLALFTPRLDDARQDRDMLQFEKWRETLCTAPPAKP